MAISPLAGKPAPKELADRRGEARTGVPRAQAGHERPESARRSSAPAATAARRCDGTFTEAHILAITQAICDYRRGQGIDGPLFMGKDTHAAVRPGPAHRAGSAGRQRRRDGHPARRRRHADAGHLARHPRLQPRPQGPPGRRHRHHAVAQPAGGRRLQVQPAQRRPGRHRRHQLDPGPRQRPAARPATPSVKRMPVRRPPSRPTTTHERISSCPTSTTCATSSTWTRSAPPASSWASIRSAAPPCTTGSRSPTSTASNITVVNPTVDPTFSLHDGRPRRQDPHGLLQPLRDGQPGQAQGPASDVAFGNDPDSDRHGIVTPSAGLMNPNHYLAVAIRYLLDAPARLAGDRPRSARRWSAAA